MVTEVLAEDGGPGDEHVENHEDEQEDEEALAELARDAFDEMGEEGVMILTRMRPRTPQKAMIGTVVRPAMFMIWLE